MAYRAREGRWWLADDEPHDLVGTCFDAVREQSSGRDAALLRYLRLYGDCPMSGYGASSYRKTDTQNYARLSFNLVRSIVGTIVSKSVKSQPRPMALPAGGTYDLRTKAQKLTKFCDGAFDAARFWRSTYGRVLTDTCVTGTGVAKYFVQHAKMRVERVFVGELYVDERDAYYGEPRTLYQVRDCDRGALAQVFPGSVADIDDAPDGDEDRLFFARSTESERVQVVEAWHLPSGPDADDGRHVVCLRNATLLDEQYEREDFPFAFLRWEDPQFGFWGEGVAERLIGLQYEVNRLLLDIQHAQYLLGNARVLVEGNSKVVPAQISNRIGTVLRYFGTKPEVVASQTVHAEVYQQLDRLVSKAYELVGVSQLSASSQKPAGLQSGRSLRVFADFESERFQQWGQSCQQFCVDLARGMIDEARAESERDPSFEVVYRGKREVERIPFRQIKLGEQEYELAIYPTSLLPTQPAGRLAALDEFANSGTLDRLGVGPAELARLADLPDFEGTLSVYTAPRDLLDKLLDRMLETGRYHAPEPFYDLELCVQIGGLTYQQWQLQGVPEERLELLRQFVEEAQALQSPPAPEASPPPDSLAIEAPANDQMAPIPAAPEMSAPALGGSA